MNKRILQTLPRVIVVAALSLFCFSSIGLAQDPFDTIPDNDPLSGQLVDPDDDEVLTPPSPDSDTIQPPAARNPLNQENVDQVVTIKDELAGWREAGQGSIGDHLNDRLRANWIMVDQNGYFSGRINVAAQGTASMQVILMNKGRVVIDTLSDEDGLFEFTNVKPGTYALVGWSEDSFFAFGMNILQYSREGLGKTQNSVVVNAVQNQTTINNDWIRYFATNVRFRIFGRYIDGEGPRDPERLYGLKGLGEFHPTAFPATSIQDHPVGTTPDGRLIGRVHQINSMSGRPTDVRNTRVILTQGDNVIASTEADNFGVFEFQDIETGDYGLVAAGEDGIGCIGINVSGSIEGEEDDEDEEDGELTVVAHPIDLALVSAETVGWIRHRAEEQAYTRIVTRERRPYVDPESTWGQGGVDPASLYRPRRDSCFRDSNQRLNQLFERQYYGETTLAPSQSQQPRNFQPRRNSLYPVNQRGVQGDFGFGLGLLNPNQNIGGFNQSPQGFAPAPQGNFPAPTFQQPLSAAPTFQQPFNVAPGFQQPVNTAPGFQQPLIPSPAQAPQGISPPSIPDNVLRSQQQAPYRNTGWQSLQLRDGTPIHGAQRAVTKYYEPKRR